VNPPSDLSRSLILGVGNLLMGDEGVGVAAIRHLEARGFAEYAELVDGGTSGFHLLDLFRDQQHLILIDAATDNQPLGTVSLIQPRYANDFPPTLTAHDIGLKDLIESAALLGYWPRVDLITVSIGDLGEMTMQLSPAVAAALPVIETMVKDRLENLGAEKATAVNPFMAGTGASGVRRKSERGDALTLGMEKASEKQMVNCGATPDCPHLPIGLLRSWLDQAG
jgi:hydrogenase maturation protease